ncbi:hypothetical protein [Bosea sp. PAMC 26642]|uniref:hypothetical protein n=1 Tax=Bosea sp. (strain PAMC 26642) TaxID=1792307 RepID=UPI0007702D42|nr:hypothetical protein [Bosea sp. PAMC 26642]AMJ61542.1 hypothetical protein AXW83_15625 [Bosea sp. PAMC 26642]
MIVRVSTGGVVAIDDLDDFARFKVTVDASSDAWADVSGRVSGKVDFADAHTAWVMVCFLRGASATAEWQDGLSKMIAKAAPHGWVSDDGSAIKAHVEWSS